MLNVLQPLRELASALPDFSERVRSLRAQLDDVAEIDWRHPIWLGLVAGTAIFERYGAPVGLDVPRVLAMSADGGTRIDTFMGREMREGPPDSPERRIARGVVRARAAIDALATVHESLPEQPLACHVRRVHGWLERPALSDVQTVAFLTEAGAFLARVRPGAEARLAEDLAAGRLPRIDLDAAEPTPAAIAISLVDAPVALARHIHRQVWTGSGGPWLGVGSATPYEVASTCHLVLDGHGHALLSVELFRRLDALRELEDELAATLRDAGAPITIIPERSRYTWRHVQPMGVASQRVDGRIPFAPATYAFGRTMARMYYTDENEWQRARFSPTFMVPVAPGASAEDPIRRRRRVRNGLMSVRMRDGTFEDLDDFRARLRAMVARVMAGEGVITRFMQAAVRLPMTRDMQRRMLGGHARPNRISPPNEVLTGRGMLSSLRLPAHATPEYGLVAVSAPPLGVAPHDPRGAAILTVVHQSGFATVTVTGTGQAADRAGAQRVLDTWLEEFASVR